MKNFINLVSERLEDPLNSPLLLFAEYVNTGLGRLQETVRRVSPRESRLHRLRND